MTKTDKGFDFASMLFGASVVILGVTLFYGTASITKSKLDQQQRLDDIERQLTMMTLKMKEIESKGHRADLDIGRIIEKMIEKHGDTTKHK
jgi:hypothetical protein|tara:strand:- start:86 stop:358 length:273 start_codon:yes stop_codon:yes gene_type:complete